MRFGVEASHAGNELVADAVNTDEGPIVAVGLPLLTLRDPRSGRSSATPIDATLVDDPLAKRRLSFASGG
jgi:hypothetical protein